MAKTSATHPLQINGVVIDQGQGEIGLTFCPGKMQPDAMSGSWDRDLSTDMAVISGYGAKALVTLMEEHELIELGVPAETIEQAANAHGVEWYHLPIRDVSTPDKSFESAWGYAGIRLRKLLAGGNRIVLHCKGGLGRTGTIAARLLVELGEEASSAIARVRKTRPGAIETREQEDYVRQCPVIENSLRSLSTSERAWACVLGGAIGDAFGYEVEFSSWAAIQQRFGEKGIQEPVMQGGRLVVSDDTQMTLFTLEGILRGTRRGRDSEAILDSIRDAYLDWYGTQRSLDGGRQPVGELARIKEIRVSRAPGNTCLSALGAGGHGSPENHINDSKGCGGVMRVAPIGWFDQFSDKEVFDVGARAAALTHGHPTGYLASGMMSAIIHSLMKGKTLKDAVKGTLTILEGWSDHKETLVAVTQAMELAEDDTISTHEAVTKLGEGWIAEEALAIGLYAALKGKNFQNVLAIGANHSGDSDSTASIAGQLWGAWQGLNGIPQRWIQSLDIYRPLTSLVGQAR